MARTREHLSLPIGVVFKTSNRSNAKTKLKVFKGNWTIDRVLSEKLPGVPEKAEILELAVGRSYIDKYKEKYNYNRNKAFDGLSKTPYNPRQLFGGSKSWTTSFDRRL